MNVNGLWRIISRPVALLTFLALMCAMPMAEAEEATVKGLKVVALEGAFKYNSGGVPLIGYITARLAEDNVTFLICRTAKTIQVNMKLLQPAPPCDKKSTPTPAPWIAWYYTTGKLVPSAKGQKTAGFVYGNISVGDLPYKYQGVVTTSKEGEPVAYSFTDYKGDMSLGVISKSPIF